MTCGTTVATGTPSSSAASAGAGVRMSETATSGANDRTNERVTRAATTAASYGFSGRSRVGKTWYSGAAENVIPAASAGSRQLLPGLDPDVVSARDQLRSQRQDRERVARVAERAEQDPHVRSRAYPTTISPTHWCQARRPSRSHPRAA